MKIENQSNGKLPRGTMRQIESVLETIPREHLRGIDYIRLVDRISDPRTKNPVQITELPGLYHPKQGGQQAWLEVALESILPRSKPLHKRLIPRLSFKGNLAAILISLIGQHYYMTLRHSIKKGQLEPSIKAYTEKHLRRWHTTQHTLRSRLFKPFQPTLERWSRSLQKRAKQERQGKR